MSKKTAKEAVIAIGKALREELDSLNKAKTTASPREAALKVAQAIQDQIKVYKEELSKMQSKENGEPLEKAFPGDPPPRPPAAPQNNVIGTNGKSLNTGSLLPSTGKFDVFRSFKNNKSKDKSGVIGATVGAGQHGAQFGLSPATVAAAKARTQRPNVLVEPHKSPVLKPKELAKPVADAIEAKKDSATPPPLPQKDSPVHSLLSQKGAAVAKEPEKMPVRDLKLKDGGKPEPKPSAPIENPAAAHPPVPTAMTPDRVKTLTAPKPTPAPAPPDEHQEKMKGDFKQWVHENILNPKPSESPAPAKEAPADKGKTTAKGKAPAKKKVKSKAAEPVKETPKTEPKKETPKTEPKSDKKPKSKLPIIDVKEGETEQQAEERTKRENEGESTTPPPKGKKEKSLPKWDKVGKGEEDLDKATNGLPGTPASNEELDNQMETKKKKSVFGILKKDALSVSKDPEKAFEKDRNDKAVLPDDKKEQEVGNKEANGKLSKQSEDLEKKSIMGGKDPSSKMMTTHALSDASKQAKNAKMPAQQQSIKMPSPSEHMDRANDLMHWMNPANHFQKMDELWDKKKKNKDKAQE